ncbi:glycosyl hydrolase family 18 protein [Pedobacter nyackensis]|uniref:glycosyl hydrolase family 18 protein n=1 Tax=Pedobacter nyackensis TaxID=475255 RepID=UPI0029319F42|nr:glycosyl hydrolase family 18 protein [Pedobacter nyackensis]
MKRIVVNFLLFLFLILFFQGHSAENRNASLVLLSAHSTDQVPSEKQEQDPKKGQSKQDPEKKNVWKAILDFLKFKSKADKKLNGKIILAIEKMGLTDSIAATSANVRVMIAELKKTKYHDLDSLQSVLSVLIKKQEEANASGQPGDNETALTPSNADLAALVNQLIPILDQRAVSETSSVDKFEKLRKLNRVKNADPATIYTLKVGDSVTRKYTLQLKNKAEVYGFFDASYKGDASTFFNSATSLIYHALSLNELTGDFDPQHGWDMATVVGKAQKNRSKVYFTVLIANKNARSSLLHAPELQRKSIANILIQLKKNKANGVNISFKNLAKKDSKRFSEFIALLHQAVQAEDKAAEVLVTLPRTNFGEAYELEELNKYTDRFFIDFATNFESKGGALAPLTGKEHETIDASYTWYLAKGIDAEKLIVILPYRGAKCETDPVTLAPISFSGYLPFNEIQLMTQSHALYNAANESMYIDTIFHNSRSYRIWYDNEVTLSKKYDYVLKNNVKGIGIYYVNYDDSFAVLNDELMYKFTDVDTTFLKSNIEPVKPKISFFEKIKRHLTLWGFILQNPCATCFESAGTNTGYSKINTYLRELEVYALVREEKLENATILDKDNGNYHKITFKEVFNYVNHELNTFLKYLTVIVFIISTGITIYYIWGVKYYTADWRYKKIVAGILFVFFSLSVLFGFTYCFTSDLIPMFGVSAASANKAGCVVDPDCVNIPLNTLLLIIAMSVLLGFLIFNYLITPLIKKDDLP